MRCCRHSRLWGLVAFFADEASQPWGGGLRRVLPIHWLASSLRYELPCKRATWWTLLSSWSKRESPWGCQLFLTFWSLIPKTCAHFFWFRLIVVWCCSKSSPTFLPDWSHIIPSKLDSKSKLTMMVVSRRECSLKKLLLKSIWACYHYGAYAGNGKE